jgi:hypothetical protein
MVMNLQKKLIDSDSGEFSDADESCVNDCGDQEFDAFLLVDVITAVWVILHI